MPEMRGGEAAAAEESERCGGRGNIAAPGSCAVAASSASSVFIRFARLGAHRGVVIVVWTTVSTALSAGGAAATAAGPRPLASDGGGSSMAPAPCDVGVSIAALAPSAPFIFTPSVLPASNRGSVQVIFPGILANAAASPG